jgi:transcriptional regulator with XRE-family HTH domain
MVLELEHIRRLRGLSQRELAEKAGVSPATVYELEVGKRPTPRPSTLRKLAEALEVEIADLFGEPVLAEKAEAPREAGRPERERSALEVAREAGRKQYEMDQKTGNRAEASQGIPQVYFARAHDEALFGDLRHRHPGELADALLDYGRYAARLEDENARQAEENARLRRDLAEHKAETEREQETAR